MSYASRTLQPILAAVALSAAFLPGVSEATIIATTTSDQCPNPGCQTVNFAGAGSGHTIIGDTNPNPTYNVYAESLVASVDLTGAGGNIGNAAGSTFGLTSFMLTPELGWGWSLIDFTLDSLNKDVPAGTGGLTFTGIDQFGNISTATSVLPISSNVGEGQHYLLYTTTEGELIVSLQIDYNYVDPLGKQNFIEDMHNIDVKSARVPEPATLALLGLGLAGVSRIRRKQA